MQERKSPLLAAGTHALAISGMSCTDETCHQQTGAPQGLPWSIWHGQHDGHGLGSTPVSVGSALVIAWAARWGWCGECAGHSMGSVLVTAWAVHQ